MSVWDKLNPEQTKAVCDRALQVWYDIPSKNREDMEYWLGLYDNKVCDMLAERIVEGVRKI